MTVRRALESELCEIRRMYRDAIGRPGCTWNENYPGEFELNLDFSGGNLYVLDHGGKLTGAVSVVAPPELSKLCRWEEDDAAEIARVVVDSPYSGRGLAGYMLRELFSMLQEQGIKAIHLSVSCENRAAVGLYRGLGFSFLGKERLYGGEFWLCEKVLG